MSLNDCICLFEKANTTHVIRVTYRVTLRLMVVLGVTDQSELKGQVCLRKAGPL